MHTTTPLEITRNIRRIVSKVVPGGHPVYIAVQPAPNAVANECFPNVAAHVERAGGSMLCGWQIWEWPHVLVEAEFHGVWLSPQGEMVDLTPKSGGENQILFVPNGRLCYGGTALDNVRLPLRDDQLIRDFVCVAEAITRVLNHGERAFQHGVVNIPAHEIEPLQMAHSFLGESLSAGMRDHDPCLCGSGAKYKRCHGRLIARIVGAYETD